MAYHKKYHYPKEYWQNIEANRPKRDRKQYFIEYNKKRINVKCKNCGKKFQRLKKATNRIYCKECRNMIKMKWENRNINNMVKGVCVC
jgi:DNA-directed RNA polymerase subunit RPC12/RpoP